MKINLKEIFKNWFNKLQYSEDELLVKEVIEKMINNADTRYRLSPLSQDLLLKNPKAKYYLLLSGNKIKISNHDFVLNNTYRASFAEEMKDLIFERMEQERKSAISEIFQNELNLLTRIKDSL